VTKEELYEAFMKFVDVMRQLLQRKGTTDYKISYHGPIFQDEEEKINPWGIKGNTTSSSSLVTSTKLS
jgi:hypothetical protein